MDGDLVGAVAGVRGLSQAGLRATVLADRRTAPALLSRHAAARAVGPDPATDPAGFAARVGAIARRQGPLVVFPSREESIDALLAPGVALPPEAILPFGGSEGLRALRDKRELPALAAAVGLHAPRTLAEGLVGDLAAQPPAVPALVKPARRGPGIPEVTLARTPAELAARLAAIPPGEEVVLQEHLDGPLGCLALVVGPGGEVAERFQQVATRIFPADAGACTVAVSVPVDDELCAASARLLANAGYAGLAQLDFIHTADGPRLIDVNPRFYISLALAVRSGVNLPAAWHAVATDRRWPGPSAYRPGMAYRRFESDVAAALRGQPRLLLARPARPRVGSVWSAADPLPGAVVSVRRVTGFVLSRAGSSSGASTAG